MRSATVADVADIVRMLADDQLGAHRESPDDLEPYLAAFAVIDADPGELLVVAEHDGRVVGTLQLSLLPGLSHRGAVRAQLEAVRVDGSVRGLGVGTRLVGWAIDEARRRGCRMVQLTSNLTRVDARRFYERLGFRHSHAGMKLDV